jgi:hypothetical protein
VPGSLDPGIPGRSEPEEKRVLARQDEEDGMVNAAGGAQPVRDGSTSDVQALALDLWGFCVVALLMTSA